MQRTFACVWWWKENSKQNSQLENAGKNVENADTNRAATNCQQRQEF